MSFFDHLYAWLFGHPDPDPDYDIFTVGERITIDTIECDVVRKLGQGGFGVAYLCRNVNRKLLCVKVTAGLNDQREIEMMRRLHDPQNNVIVHPHIVPLLAFAQVRRHRTTFNLLCTRYVSEGDIAQKRNEVPHKFTEDVVKTIYYQILSALADLHRRNIIHGDVSPYNILLENFEERAGNNVTLIVKAVLCDFGISKATANSNGTVPFAAHPVFGAPECRRDRLLSAASDLYSLAATTVFLLYGEKKDFRRVAEERVKCEDLRRILLRCLEDNPAGRYSNAMAVFDGPGNDCLMLWHEVTDKIPTTVGEEFGRLVRAHQVFANSTLASTKQNITSAVESTMQALNTGTAEEGIPAV